MNDTSQRVEIELLKKDVVIISTLCEKFDKTIDKMQEIASNLSKMVSLQEQRLENQEENTKELENVLELRRLEHNNDIKELHSRITTVNRELTEKIEESEKTILAELECIKRELTKEKESIVARLGKIEIWKYSVVGGLMVITWLAARIDIVKILFSR